MDAKEKALGQKLQDKLAEHKKYDRKVGTLLVRNADNAAKRAKARADEAWKAVKKLRKQLRDIDRRR